jgi:hypothetical protein
MNQGPIWGLYMKETRDQKSRATVPWNCSRQWFPGRCIRGRTDKVWTLDSLILSKIIPNPILQLPIPFLHTHEKTFFLQNFVLIVTVYFPSEQYGSLTVFNTFDSKFAAERNISQYSLGSGFTFVSFPLGFRTKSSHSPPHPTPSVAKIIDIKRS